MTYHLRLKNLCQITFNLGEYEILHRMMCGIASTETLLTTQPLSDKIISFVQTYKFYNFINKTSMINYNYKQQLHNKIKNLESELESI